MKGIIDKLKEFWKSLSSKQKTIGRIAVGAVLSLVIVFCVMVLKDKKLSGWYAYYDSGCVKYKFEVGNSNIGDYGGDCYTYDDGECAEIEPWYVDDGIVYISGEAWKQYDGKYLYDIDPEEDIIITENNKPVGAIGNYDRRSYGSMYFYPDGSVGYWLYRWDLGEYHLTAEHYSVKGNVVIVIFEDYDGYEQMGFLIKDGKLYGGVLHAE